MYAILRIVAGFLFFCHGAQKILGMFGGMGGSGAKAELASMAGLAGVIELVCGILICIGLFGGYAAFLASGLMAFAYFIGHFEMEAFWPVQNGGELAVVYCFLFLYIATRGSGTWSVDAAMGQRAHAH